jgi:hypothetical protein
MLMEGLQVWKIESVEEDDMRATFSGEVVRTASEFVYVKPLSVVLSARPFPHKSKLRIDLGAATCKEEEGKITCFEQET